MFKVSMQGWIEGIFMNGRFWNLYIFGIPEMLLALTLCKYFYNTNSTFGHPQ